MFSNKSNGLKMTPTTLPTIAGNASTASPASPLSASVSLFDHLFRSLSSFGGEPKVEYVEGIGERLCILQKMDQRVMQQKFSGPLRAIKLHNTKRGKENVRLVLLIFGS